MTKYKTALTHEAVALKMGGIKEIEEERELVAGSVFFTFEGKRDCRKVIELTKQGRLKQNPFNVILYYRDYVEKAVAMKRNGRGRYELH